MVEILNRCNYLYNNLKDCIDKSINEKKNGNCLICTKNNFHGLQNDSYDCLKKLSTYTMFYGPLYVNEIYNFLVQSNFLKSYIEEQRNIIKNSLFSGYDNSTPDNLIPIFLNIMSLGCGFGPDDIALNKYRDNHLDWNVNFNYYGYDKEPLWNFITQNNALPITVDLLMGMNFQNVHILFINKLFSTLRNFNLGENFLTVLGNALQNLPPDSFVIFNDINNRVEGRDAFNDFAISNNLQEINKYYFDGYTGNYIKLEMNDNVVNLINNPAVANKDYLNQTIFFLYKKV
ncbi:hypothetical protein L5F64_02545 [Aliarcobacter butzleri]|uniref:hypothetical protein n=1 Tax=Aliarcobacter butzleri TaxID=28197 RepID=UPI001EDBC57F|nr:hypothetical protein [Aliarcobacter butzleri]MCG3710369.1 hypothetical protein [Aliarcobacter butzleri]MCG3714444.1 hypothetical protein [Aliarcobacter butzleri]